MYLCTNALLLEKKLDQYEPIPYLTFSVHLDGNREHARQVGVPGRRVRTRRRGNQGREGQAASASTINCTMFDNADAEDIAAFFDRSRRSASTGSRCRRAMHTSARLISSTSSTAQHQGAVPQDLRARQGQGWRFRQSGLFLDFLAGNQEAITARRGAMPTRNIFGWQKPCYLLGEGYAKTFKELMETTAWDPMAPAPTRNVRTAWRTAATSRRGHDPRSEAVHRAQDRAVRGKDRRRDGAGIRSPTSARRNTCSSSRCTRR